MKTNATNGRLQPQPGWHAACTFAIATTPSARPYWYSTSEYSLESLRNQLASKLLAVESLDDVPARPERTTVDFHRMVKWLPDREAEVFLRRYRERQSLTTIAADLGVSVRVVQEDIKKARRAIRVHWGARQHELVEGGSSNTPCPRSSKRRKKAR